MKTLGLLLACAIATGVVVGGCGDDDAATPATGTLDSGLPSTDTDSGNQPTVDSSTGTDSGTDAPATSCTAAEATLLTPIDKTSTGAVTILETATDSRTVFVDASAGGTAMAATNPRIYINLETLTAVPVTDVTAKTSTAWDLALKRPILFTNGGDGGSGNGGSALLDGVDFATATATATLKTESFFDADCNAKKDATGAVLTTFDGWYDYDAPTMHLTPHPGTWIVKGGTGKTYRVEVLSYYANPDGTEGMAGGRYTLKVGAL